MPDLTAAVEKIARDPRVQAVYLFGSRARGDARAESDVDLGVLLDVCVTLDDELWMRSEIAAALGRDDVDLVLLRSAPPLLKHEVVTNGSRRYARDAAAADDFEARATMEYFDTAHLREVQRDLAREAIR